MSRSITTYNGKHVEINDTFVQAWMYYAAQEICRLDCHESWVTELSAYWRTSAEDDIGALMDAKFDVYVTNESRRQIVLRAARRVLNILIGFGDKIPVNVLESMRTSKTYWSGDVLTEGFVKAARGLIKLLEGNYAPDEAASAIW